MSRDTTDPWTHIAPAVAKIVAREVSRLFEAHSILELVIESIGDEIDNGKPAIKPALRAASAVISASIEELEPICAAELEVTP